MISFIHNLLSKPKWNEEKTPDKIGGKIVGAAALILAGNSKNPIESLKKQIIRLFEKYGDKELSHLQQIADLFNKLKKPKVNFFEGSQEIKKPLYLTVECLGGKISPTIKEAFQSLINERKKASE